jgi:O-antigen ligase/lipoprotein NlpI
MPVIDKKSPVISDYVVLLFIGAILVIDFLPYFKTMEIINPQFLYLSGINILMGLYFYFSQKSIAIEGLSILKRSYLTWLYFAFLVLCGLSVFVANNISLVITGFTEIAIVFLLFVNLTILLKDKQSIFYKIAFLVCISAFLQSFQELYNLIVTSNRSSIVEALNQMKGNTGNINILAASLSIKIPFLLFGITHFSGNKKWFVLFTTFLVSTSIILTGARTAFIDLFLVLLIYIFYHLKTNSFNKSAVIKSLYLIIPILFSVFIANVVFNKSKVNDGRYVSVTNRIKQINTKDASAQKRFMMWENALELTKAHPVLGVGLGNYRIESIPYEKTKQDDYEVSLHTHNDFLEIMSETGIVNGLIYLSLFVAIFFINLKRILKSNDENTRIIALITLLLVIIYGIDSLFNFPMYRPTMQIFLALLFAFTLVNNPVLNDKLSDLKGNANIYSAIIVFSVISCFSAFLLCRASNLEYLIKTDDINNNVSGVLNGDEVINRLPLYPNVFGTSESYYEYAGIYYLREKNYEKSLKCFYEANKINPYIGRVDFYKHLVFEEMGKPDSAYVAIKRTFYLRPRDYFFYKRSINTAAKIQDTVEILKEHKLFTKFRNFSDEWKQTAYVLQSSGYNRKNLLHFVDEGLKKLPNDSLLIRQKKDFMVTGFIIEGQKFASQGNLDKTFESYNKALKVDPGNIFAMQNIGFYYYNLGQYNKAITYFQNALKYPGLNDGHTEYYMGISYLKINDKVNACKYFNLSKTKNYPDAQRQIDLNCK